MGLSSCMGTVKGGAQLMYGDSEGWGSAYVWGQ